VSADNIGKYFTDPYSNPPFTHIYGDAANIEGVEAYTTNMSGCLNGELSIILQTMVELNVLLLIAWIGGPITEVLMVIPGQELHWLAISSV
jgi:hypothetical protein